MKTIPTDSSTFPDVTVYEQSDPYPGGARAIEVPVAQLAQRTEYLRQAIGGGSGGNTTAEYVLGASCADLPNARVVSGTNGVHVDATTAGQIVLSPVYGTIANTVCAGNDSRLITLSGDLGGTNTNQTVVGINGTPIKAGSYFGEGDAIACDENGEFYPVRVYSPDTMGSEGGIPVAGPPGGSFATVLPLLQGWPLVTSEQGTPAYEPVSAWRRTSGYVVTSSSISVTLTAPYPSPAVGLPVRISDSSPIIYSDTYSNYAGIFGGLSGTLHVYADARGRIYPSLVSDGSGYFHLAFYSDAARTVLFGHTATFNAVGTFAFVPDNGCSLSGTVTIAGTLTANSTAVLQLFKYLQITAVSGSTLTLAGPALSTGAGKIQAIWIGGQEKIRPLDIVIQGSYSGVTTNQAIQDRTGCKCFCDFAEAHLVALKAIHLTADSTVQPKISLMHNGGLTVSDANALAVSTSRVLSGIEVIDNKRAIAFGQAIELRVQKLGTGDASDLSAVAIYVLE